MAVFTCSLCKKSAEAKRLPPGWKNPTGGMICKTCWRSGHHIIAVAIPVVGVADGQDNEEFRQAMMAAFREATNLYNWSFRQLLHADYVRDQSMERQPAMPKVDLYKLYNETGAPIANLAAHTRTAVFRMAQSEYKGPSGSYRRAALWEGTRGVPLKRFPAPFPVHNQGWTTALLGNKPAISFRLHGESEGPRWTARLACGGNRWAQAMTRFRWLHEHGGGGSYSACPWRGELNLYVQRCSAADDGIVLFFKRPGGGQVIPQRLMAKLVFYEPRRAPRPASGELILRTEKDRLWSAVHDGRPVHPWVLNEDEMTRFFARLRDDHQAHAEWVQRMSEDYKMERRTDTGSRAQHLDALSARCDRHRRKMNTWIDQLVAMVVNYCIRRKIAGVRYNDDERRWSCSFPWFQLRTTLARRCARDRIDLVASGAAIDLDGDEEST